MAKFISVPESEITVNIERITSFGPDDTPEYFEIIFSDGFGAGLIGWRFKSEERRNIVLMKIKHFIGEKEL